MCNRRVLVDMCQNIHPCHEGPPATRGHFGSEPAVSPHGRYYCITKLAVTKKILIRKIRKKLPNHENACVNTPCNFRDRMSSRLVVGYLTHVIHTSLARLYYYICKKMQVPVIINITHLFHQTCSCSCH